MEEAVMEWPALAAGVSSQPGLPVISGWTSTASTRSRSSKVSSKAGAATCPAALAPEECPQCELTASSRQKIPLLRP